MHRLVWTQVGSDTDWTNVECGAEFTLAIKTNGTLYGTGENDYGQLGLADNTNRNVFTEISSGWKTVTYYNLPSFGGGYSHSLAIMVANLRSTGRNTTGQLAISSSGAGTDKNEFDVITQSIPDRGTDFWKFVVCGQYHTMALRT